MQTEVLQINGHRIGYAQFGSGDGYPLFYFHGFPGCHVEGYLLGFPEVAVKYGLRILCIDRPGMGLSPFEPGRSMIDWPATVAAVADRLGIPKFSVIGLSGGGPYVLATAFGIPHRLQSAVIVAGMVPMGYPGTRNDLAMTLPRSTPVVRKMLAHLFRFGVRNAPIWFVRWAVNVLPPADRQLFSDPKPLNQLLALYRSALQQGTAGHIHESEIYRNFWGFRPQDVQFPVSLWHGTEDRNVKLASARELARQLPRCTRHFIRGQGHFSLFRNYKDEILKGIRLPNAS